MEHAGWPAEFEVIVRSYLSSPPAVGELDPDLDLFAAGIDSLATIGLMTDLEKRFDFEFPDELLSTNTFSTPGTLWSAISANLFIDTD